MTASEIRQAAQTLRERADAATPGPWRVSSEGSEGSRLGPAHGGPREASKFIGILNGRVQPEDGLNAAYVATVDPSIGALFADLLDSLADALIEGSNAQVAITVDANRIARDINGGGE